MAGNELAICENFNMAILDGSFAEAVAEEMEGLGSVPYDRVKIPSGGGLAFEIPGETDEDTETATEIVGVILYHHPVNAYWASKFAGGNEQPDCSSVDGKRGVERDSGEMRDCASCPFNQFGSDGGKGKSCKNAHRIYMLREGSPVPMILSLPPTSLKFMRDYISKKILLKGMRSYQVVTKLTLKKEKNAAGILYSRVAFAFGGKLNPEQAAAAEQMSNSIRQMDKSVDVDGADYGETAQKAGNADFTEVQNEPEVDLPF